MSIEFSKLVFHNQETVFDVGLSIFAPPDRLFASGVTVKAGQSTTLQSIASDCSAVKISVTIQDPDHGSTFTATFGVSPPLFLQSVEVASADGEFQATVSGSTDPGPGAKKAAAKKKAY
jgi:hypothetical protein